MDLGDRKKIILRALIDDYISTAEPVGSRTIAKKYDMGLSSATIRNEMADLEELGLLEQPHASAGRIPSDKGYRYYVNELMKIDKLSEDETGMIKSLLELTTINEMEKIVRRTARLLSQITNYTSAIIAPSVKRNTIKSIQLINATTSDLVAVIVTDSGIIKHTVIKLPRQIEESTIQRINNMLNEKIRGRAIEDINISIISSIQVGMKGYDEIFNAILPVIYDSLKEEDDNIVLEGAANIFNYPEYNDIEKAKDFLSMIEQKDMLSDLFTDKNEELSISIGEENVPKNVKNCSIVKATYKLGDKSLGTVGIIGPTRMNYSRVIAILNCFSTTLNEILKNTFDY